MENMKLSFWGAAGNVTGSQYLLTYGTRKILVDCGLYQEHDLKDRNWEDFAFNPAELDCVLLTHAHLDHCGRLPRLVKAGFRGKIHCTKATAELAKIVLEDCAKINEEDAQNKARRHAQEGRKGPYPDLPLYTLEDAQAVLPLFETHDNDTPLEILPGVTVQFLGVGHILGASSVRVIAHEGKEYRSVVFSGDVGREKMPLLRDPEKVGQADYVVCESTYGDRLHDAKDLLLPRLEEVVNDTVRRGGNLVIPSFAIERTQDLLYYLAVLLKEDRIPHLQIFVDSPMAVKVIEVFCRNAEQVDDETKELLRGYRMPGVNLVRSIADSKSINRIRGTAIILAGAGMCTGGRIKHHLLRNLPHPESTVLFVGYQARNTLGREIIEGKNPVRVLGEDVPVQAKIVQLDGFSAHADQQELLDWLGTVSGRPQLFVTHGEPEASGAFAEKARDMLGWNVRIPEYGETIELL